MPDKTLDDTIDSMLIAKNTLPNSLVTIADDKQDLTELINAALDDNNAKLAFTLCNKAIENNPDDAKAHRHLGLLNGRLVTYGEIILLNTIN